MASETPEQLMARMNATYGISSTAQPAPPPQPAAPPAPVQKQEPKKRGLIDSAMGILGGRREQIDKASGYANGGIVKGKGTPTSDDVPVSIKGRKVNLSDTEAVLPSKSRQALGEMLGYDAQSKLISSVSQYYNARTQAKELYFKGSQHNADLDQGAKTENLKSELAMVDSWVKAMLAEIQSLTQQAVSNFNNLHLQASEGSSNSFQLRQEV